MRWHRVKLGGACLGFGALLLALVAAAPAHAGEVLTDLPKTIDPQARYLFYLHGRILELQGRHAVSPQHGPYEYDAILKALAGRGFSVISELRGAATGPEYAQKVAGQVRRLRAAGVPVSGITVAGFSKGGSLTLGVAAEVAEAGVSYVVMAGCGASAPEFAPRLKGRVLSLYDRNDDIAGSCGAVFAKAPGLVTREIVLTVGKGHGTFFTPRAEWLEPLAAWAGGS